MEIATKLKEIRKRLNLTGEEIGKKAGVSRSYIARLESGETPSLERAFMIEKALGLNGELSNLVIAAAQRTAGVWSPAGAVKSPPASGTQEQHNMVGLNLEAIWLTHNCPSCGAKAPIRVAIS